MAHDVATVMRRTLSFPALRGLRRPGVADDDELWETEMQKLQMNEPELGAMLRASEHAFRLGIRSTSGLAPSAPNPTAFAALRGHPRYEDLRRAAQMEDVDEALARARVVLGDGSPELLEAILSDPWEFRRMTEESAPAASTRRGAAAAPPVVREAAAAAPSPYGPADEATWQLRVEKALRAHPDMALLGRAARAGDDGAWHEALDAVADPDLGCFLRENPDIKPWLRHCAPPGPGDVCSIALFRMHPQIAELLTLMRDGKGDTLFTEALPSLSQNNTDLFVLITLTMDEFKQMATAPAAATPSPFVYGRADDQTWRRRVRAALRAHPDLAALGRAARAGDDRAWVEALDAVADTEVGSLFGHDPALKELLRVCPPPRPGDVGSLAQFRAHPLLNHIITVIRNDKRNDKVAFTAALESVSRSDPELFLLITMNMMEFHRMVNDYPAAAAAAPRPAAPPATNAAPDRDTEPPAAAPKPKKKTRRGGKKKAKPKAPPLEPALANLAKNQFFVGEIKGNGLDGTWGFARGETEGRFGYRFPQGDAILHPRNATPRPANGAYAGRYSYGVPTVTSERVADQLRLEFAPTRTGFHVAVRGFAHTECEPTSPDLKNSLDFVCVGLCDAYGKSFYLARYYYATPRERDVALREAEAALHKFRRRRCTACGRDARPDETHFRLCSGCDTHRYCSIECQTEAWAAGHSKNCHLFKRGLKRGNRSILPRAAEKQADDQAIARLNSWWRNAVEVTFPGDADWATPWPVLLGADESPGPSQTR